MNACSPNVLFLITDQHRAMSTGCYGRGEVETTNIDTLAESSCLFENAYCQYPICLSSRQSILTGQYPGRNGSYQNFGQSIDPTQWTLAGAFTRAGYDTTLIGKAHCNENGFLENFNYERCAERYWPKEVYERIQPPLFGMDYRRNAATAGVWSHEEELLQCYFVERHTRNWLQRNRKRPFFAWVSFDYPHPPFLVPRRFWDRFDPEGFTLPPVDPVQPVHPFWGEELVNEIMIRNYLRGYTAALACVDECIGRILDAVERSRLLEDTIIIYTSDHGEAGGHHGKYEKHSFFDPEVRVPLLVRVPGNGGEARRVDSIVELLDLAPTLKSWCGLDGNPEGFDGDSLDGLIAGQNYGWKDRALCENYWPERTERDGTHLAEAYSRMLVRDGFKCWIGANPPFEHCLYDLKNGPFELENLWDREEHRSRRDRMVGEIERDWIKIPEPQQPVFN